MYFSLIICTLGEREVELRRLISSLELQTFKDFEAIFLSQSNHSVVEQILKTTSINYRHIKLNKKGLSYSRNQGFKFCSGEYITISDDDCWYFSKSLELVKDVIEKKKNEIDVFSFKIFDPINDISFKTNYCSTGKRLNQYTVTRCSSIEIFFKKNIIESVKFDEEFGVGAKYNSGEENIFLVDILRKGYRIEYTPIDVVYHKARVLQQKKFDTYFLYVKYHVFVRMYGCLKGSFLYYLFYFKKFGKISNRISGLFPNLYSLANKHL